MAILAYINKKVHELDDREWLKSMRQVMSKAELAQHLNCFSGSISWAEARKFTKEERSTFVYKRRHLDK